MAHQTQIAALGEITELHTEHGFDGLAQAVTTLLNEVIKVERSHALGGGPTNGPNTATATPTASSPGPCTPTRPGALTVAVPQTRGDEFYPSTLEKGVRSERALKPAVAEMYVQWVSTRKVAAITEELCGLEVTSAEVSRAAEALEEELEKWRTRPLGETPYLILDARYEKVRHAGVHRSGSTRRSSGVRGWPGCSRTTHPPSDW
jgi:transposase-like protein